LGPARANGQRHVNLIPLILAAEDRKAAATRPVGLVSVLSVDKELLLKGFLGELPKDVASRLAKAVEVDRLIGGFALPHDEILRALRPQLKGSGSPTRRVPTPQRLFCRPFSDLLVSGERKEKQKGRIARSSVDTVWTWLAQELMPARHHKLNASLSEAVLGDNEDQIERDLRQFWSEASAALKAALADEQQRMVAAQKLGGAAIAADAAEMARMLADAQTVTEIQTQLPKPITQLTQDDIWFLCDLIDRVTPSNPDFVPYIALIVLGRLERPWEVLRLVTAISRKSTDIVISGTDMDIVGELLFSDLDVYAANIQSARPINFDPDQVLASLAGFTELSSGMIKELGIRRDGKWGQRLAKDRAAVAQVMESLLQRARKEILAALPSHKGLAFAKRQRGLDLSRPIDPDRVARATRYAQLIAHSRPFAVAGAFSSRLMKVTDETALALRTYGEDILSELRGTAPESRLRAGEHLKVMLSLCELVLGGSETDFLRRRARVPAA